MLLVLVCSCPCLWSNTLVTAKLHHTNIVPVFEVGHDKEYSFYAMQLIKGQGLDHVIDDLLDLRRALDELPDRMRATVCLHYLSDLTVEQVADTLDVSPGTVKSNLHDARNRLRTVLGEVSDA